MYIYPSQLTQLASSSWVGGLGFCDGAESSIAIRSFIVQVIESTRWNAWCLGRLKGWAGCVST